MVNRADHPNPSQTNQHDASSGSVSYPWLDLLQSTWVNPAAADAATQALSSLDVPEVVDDPTVQAVGAIAAGYGAFEVGYRLKTGQWRKVVEKR